jgi:hypothetical protein
MRCGERHGSTQEWEGRPVRVMKGMVVAFALFGTAAAAQTTPTNAAQALTLTEVVELRRGGVPTSQILQSAREYCVAFIVADSAERELRSAGADSTLIEGLRGVCRAPTVALASAAETAASFFIDDDFKEIKRLPTSVLSSQPCRSRYDDNGFTLTSADAQLGCTVGYPSGALEGDLRIEVDVAVSSGSNATVAIGFARARTSWDRLSFNVQSNGRYELCRFTGPRCTRLIPTNSGTQAWRRAARAQNRLAIEIEGTIVRLFVNDTKVAETDAGGDTTGHIVLGVGPSASVNFRQLRVTRLGRS